LEVAAEECDKVPGLFRHAKNTWYYKADYACVLITFLAAFVNSQHEGTVIYKSDKLTLVNQYSPKLCYLYHFIS
jgi:hypothetical protein